MDIPEDMKERYLERRKVDASACTQAVQERDFYHLQRVGHQLKGNALSFGYPELAKIGEALEDVSTREDIEGCREQVHQLVLWVKNSAK